MIGSRVLRALVMLASTAAVVASLAACDPGDVTAQGGCRWVDGKYLCSATLTPATPVAPTPSSSPAPTTSSPASTSSSPAPTTTRSPATTTPPTTVPPVTIAPPVTNPPNTSDGATAAALRGWGTPLPASDEFNYTGAPNTSKWNVAGECWSGHAGNGKRCASRSTADGSKLVQTGLSNGDSAWLASKLDQRYGKWEARVRSKGVGAGNPYHPLLIIWSASNRWPEDGEYDFLENGAPGQTCAESFIHYPHAASVSTQQEFARETSCGSPLTEWHNVAFEWTPDYVAGYIDGKQWFRYAGGANGARQAIQSMPAGHLTIQLDNFYGASMQPATYEVDWVRIYR